MSNSASRPALSSLSLRATSVVLGCGLLASACGVGAPGPRLDLSDRWSFRAGDDPGWAEPEIDESLWLSVRISGGKGATHADAERSWYRQRVLLPDAWDGRPLGLRLGKVDTAYEVFVDGERLGSVGSLPPDPAPDYDRELAVALPDSATVDGEIVVALRVWKGAMTAGTVGGPFEGDFFVAPAEIALTSPLLDELTELMLVAVYVAASIFGLLLLVRRGEGLYGWFALLGAAFAAYTLMRSQGKYVLLDLDFPVLKEIEFLAMGAVVVAFVEFVWAILETRVDRVVRTLQVATAGVCFFVGLTPGLRWNAASHPTFQALLVALILIGGWRLFGGGVLTDRPGAAWIIGGAFLGAVAAARDIGVDQGWWGEPRTAPFGFCVILASLGLAMAERTHRARRELEGLREELEQRVEERTRELQRANRAKSDFLSSVSHDIRTPLHAIVGLTEILESRAGPEDAELIQQLSSSASTLQSLVGGVLDFAKIETGNLDRRLQRFDVRRLLGDVRKVLQVEAERKGIELRVKVDESLQTELLGEVDVVRQVLMNLGANAVRYTVEGRVELRASLLAESEERAEVRFEVRDSGPGISRELAERIFQPWERGGAPGERTSGFGLGLAIVARLIEAVGGRISFEVPESGGTRFLADFEFEKVRGAVAEPPSTGELAVRLSGTDSTILIVDDVEVNRLVARTVLEAAGPRVLEASTGTEALRILERESVDLVLLDLRLPDVDGAEVCRRIRTSGARGAEIPVVGLSASALVEDRDRCLASGMDEFLAKPASRRVLLRCLSRYLALSEEGREGAPAAVDRAPTSRLLDDARVSSVLRAARGISKPDLPGALIHSVRASADEHLGALRSGDCSVDEAVSRLHALRGSAASVGLGRLAAACREAEVSVGNGGSVAEWVDHLLEEVTEGLQALREVVVAEGFDPDVDPAEE